jgi:NAD(P)-dependent dehydrogenase (short-subunit alcohol dehydrogenase family)
MSAPPAHSGYAFPGWDNLHNDIYPAISVAKTPSLKQEGKTVLITGGSRGIGRAITLQYAHAGVASIIITARGSSALDGVEQEINKINKDIRVLKFPLDVSDADAVRKCAEEVTAKEGRLDILVNNAGATDPWKPLAETDPSAWWSTWETNVKGPYLFLHAFLPLLMATAEKHKVVTDVINMTSIGAHVTLPGASAYGGSKLALLRLTEFVNMEYGAKGVNVVSLHPGGVPTESALKEPTIAARESCSSPFRLVNPRRGIWDE